MTLLQRALAHYVQICEQGPAQKAAAWHCAKQLAEKCPELLSDLPDLLRVEMLRRKSQEQQIAQGGKSE